MKKQLLLLVMALLPMVAMADDSGQCGENVTWTYEEGTHTLSISGTGDMRNYDIYENGYYDNEKGEYVSSFYCDHPWSAFRTEIEKVVIEDGVTSIGSYSFYKLENLQNIRISKSVKSFGYSVFYGCSRLSFIVVDSENPIYDSRDDCNAIIISETNTLLLGCKNTTIPNSVTSIGNGAFSGCTGLTSVTIPNSVTSIGSRAFEGCSGLTSVTIPNSVTSIGNGAFSGTSWYNNQPDGLVYAGKVAYNYKGTMPANTTVDIEEGTMGIAGGAFFGCRNLKSITIPESVTSIGDWAFQDCTGLTSITIPNSVTSIGQGAFYGCSGLTSLTIPNSVTSIGWSAFQGCTSLTSVTIPNSVTSIGWGAFQGCNLNSVTLEDISTWLYLPSSDFFSGAQVYLNDEIIQNISSVVIPEGITSIRNNAFSGFTKLKSLTIPNSVTGIDQYAFENCSGLTSVVIPDNVTYIGYAAFQGCNCLTSVTIPNSLASISDWVFQRCSSLTSITIPNSVTSIGNGSFRGCSGLTSVHIGRNLKEIAYNAFEGCNSVAKVFIDDILPWLNISLEETFNKAQVYLNDELIQNITSVVIPEGITTIRYNAFNNFKNLTSVTIAKSVTSIGNHAFANCPNLAEVRCLPQNVPNTYDAFDGTYIEYATLYVPAMSYNEYRSTYPWSGFKYIFNIEGSQGPKCAKPTIKYLNGMIDFECETENAEFVATVTSADPGTYYDKTINLGLKYKIVVYAKAYGYLDSDIATAEIDVRGIQGDTNRDGKVTITDAVSVVNIILNNGEATAPALQNEEDIKEPE